jgi:ribosome-binding protein aMBF1 (putative translation factor)
MENKVTRKCGEAIRTARLHKEITYKELSDKINKKPSFISGGENGLHRFDDSTLKDICKELDLNYEYIKSLRDH